MLYVALLVLYLSFAYLMITISLARYLKSHPSLRTEVSSRARQLVNSLPGYIPGATDTAISMSILSVVPDSVIDRIYKLWLVRIPAVGVLTGVAGWVFYSLVTHPDVA